MLCLVEAHRRAGRPLRVLITAMTNAAINNCLAKLTELQDQHGVVKRDFLVGKLQGDGTGGIKSIDPKRAGDGIAELCVFGATVWQARKTSPDNLSYDLVVIDEGSQLRVADSAIAIRRVADGGRLLIAGDDKQLAPIVQAEYPTPEDGLPLHRSILEALRAGDADGELTRTLVENFRMNDRLCEYPRLSIYPAEYLPATDEIAARRIKLGPRKHSSLVVELIDPAWPLTICVFEDVKATSRNPVEAKLAAEVVTALREGVAVADDGEFARESVFVVSPHHAQIRLLRRALAELRTWNPMPLVDTVDKTQGQERDAVVVSYGVSDVETALNEKHFIFSLNRLNVAVTRARAKTVLFLPRPLLEPPIQVLDDDEVAEGIAYMQGMVHWCREQSEPVSRMAGQHRVTIFRG
jgi:superfamily I DNA and/or RNA helicase